MGFLELKIPPPVVAGLVGGLMWVLSVLAPGWRIPLALGRAGAVIFMVLGLGVAGAGIAAFVRSRTTIDPHHPEHSSKLVTTGIYARTRNPMYLGLTSILIAWSFVLGSPPTLLFVPVFMGFIRRFQITPEERQLRTLFGERFETYARRVPRWL
ncbi:MAG: isoprenylcysteine carboxylmethyltransferase family protein [Myxococcota bacterium]